MKKIFTTLLMAIISVISMAEPTHLFVSGANVRIRSTGNTSGQVVATLPLGTWAEIIETGTEKQNLVGKSDFWYKVRDEKNNEGWIFGGLTLKCNADEKFITAAELVRLRVEQYGRPLEEAEQLYTFTQKLVGQATIADDLARAELAKLQSLQLILNTLSAMMRGSDESHPAQKENSKDIYYHESAGQFYILPEVFWRLAEKHKNTAIADDIAWEATKQQLPGETEGDPTAVLAMLNLAEARYLKLFPRGKFVKQALETVKISLKEMPAGLQNYFSGEFVSYRESFIKELSELVEAVKNSDGEHSQVLKLAEEVKKAALN